MLPCGEQGDSVEMGKSVDGADVKTKLSIVAPCYNEAEGLSEFCRRLLRDHPRR
jgi:hypothetical protein